MQRLLIVAGELSGDMHGAMLAQALKQEDDSLFILGVGGRYMKEAGIDIVHGIEDLDVVGTIGIKQAKAVLKTYLKVRGFLKVTPPDLVVFIDNPGLNLKLAAVAKSEGIKVIYFIAPQVWAWHKSRVKQMKRVIDHLITILPFEEQFFLSAGIPSTFVGHPLLERIGPYESSAKEKLRNSFSISQSDLVIGVLPGSRSSEVRAHLPTMLKALLDVRLTSKFQVLIPVAESLDKSAIEAICQVYPFKIQCVHGRAVDVMKAADLLLVASGTATLQAGFLGVPMIIVYRTSWITYFLARCLIKVRWIGLVNIVMGRSVVPELIQHDFNRSKLSGLVQSLLSDHGYYHDMCNDLAEVRKKTHSLGAAKRAARIILHHLNERPPTV